MSILLQRLTHDWPARRRGGAGFHSLRAIDATVGVARGMFGDSMTILGNALTQAAHDARWSPQ